jgi:hypothetical protein
MDATRAASECSPYSWSQQFFEELAECLWALGEFEEARPYFHSAQIELSKDPWFVSQEPARLRRLRRFLGVGDRFRNGMRLRAPPANAEASSAGRRSFPSVLAT